MDFAKSYAIAIKDIKEVFSSVSIYGPMLGVPLFFSILLPVLTFYVAIYAAPAIAARIIPQAVVTAASANNPNSLNFMLFFTVNVLGPVFLTMPILTASVIAADSFAGEKERKTSEALLSTPVSVPEMLFGKVMASLIPTVLLTILIFALYGTITNSLSFKAFGAYLLPTAPWLLMLLTSPFLAIATIGIVVLVSSHVKGIKEAQQISTLLVLPILIMPFVSILGIANLTVDFFVYAIAALAIIDVAVIYVGVRSFKKEAII
jgi:ABC-type transport system involved in multi-copper enzyme maturation permease subunit